MRRIAFVLLIISFASCRPEVFTPKPRGYYKIDLPKEHTYQSFSPQGFPYSFEHPTYSRAQSDTSFFGEKPENPYWLILDYESLGGKIYLSYKTIDKQNKLQRLIEDSYGMSFTVHSVRADVIEDAIFHFDDRNVHGIFYNVGGDAASAYQFYATDSNRHFIRGALYFNTKPNADSLRPVTTFIKKDIDHMLETLEWH